MDKYNKKNWLVFFFARHFYTGNGKRHGLAPAPVRRGTMAEKDRKGGGGVSPVQRGGRRKRIGRAQQQLGRHSWRTRAWCGRQRSSELRIAPASMVEQQQLGSSSWPARARRRLSRRDRGEADGIAAGSLELDGDP
jgi:hypothetical protein